MPDDHKEMRDQIAQAEVAAQETRTVELRVSRQDYRDLVDAYRFLRQASPLQTSIGVRLEKLGLQIREALDQTGG
jgi:hypothetical protein